MINFARAIGFFISFAGMVTFKKADNVRENVAMTPTGLLLLETDCPYLAPEPHRGEVNEPSYIPLIAKEIARITGIAVEELARATSENAADLFGI